MKPLALLRESAVSRLWSAVNKPDALGKYRAAGAFLFAADDFLVSTVQVPDVLPELQHGSDDDAANAIALYGWLGEIEEVLATDPRLWVTLTHDQFASYTRSRWPPPQDPGKAINSIRSHWFVGGGLGGLRRNSIARLWWAAHMTHAPWEDDHEGGEFAAFKPADGDSFVYTRVLLRNQNVYQALVEREFGSSRRVLIAMLEVIRRDVTTRATDAFSNALGKQVNLLSAFREISALPVSLLVTTFETLASGLGPAAP